MDPNYHDALPAGVLVWLRAHVKQEELDAVVEAGISYEDFYGSLTPEEFRTQLTQPLLSGEWGETLEHDAAERLCGGMVNLLAESKSAIAPPIVIYACVLIMTHWRSAPAHDRWEIMMTNLLAASHRYANTELDRLLIEFLAPVAAQNDYPGDDATFAISVLSLRVARSMLNSYQEDWSKGGRSDYGLAARSDHHAYFEAAARDSLAMHEYLMEFVPKKP